MGKFKFNRWYIAVSLVLTFSTVFGQNLALVNENQYLIGEWSGLGKFFDTNIRDKIGEIPISIIIGPKGHITARIDAFVLNNVKLSKAKYGFEIRGDIQPFEKNGVSLRKDKVSILLVLPKERRVETTTSDANFHLKSNHFFDITLRVGGVVLTKH